MINETPKDSAAAPLSYIYTQNRLIRISWFLTDTLAQELALIEDHATLAESDGQKTMTLQYSSDSIPVTIILNESGTQEIHCSDSSRFREVARILKKVKIQYLEQVVTLDDQRLASLMNNPDRGFVTNKIFDKTIARCRRSLISIFPSGIASHSSPSCIDDDCNGKRCVPHKRRP